MASIASKTQKLQRYQRYDDEWLLIYVNHSLPAVNIGMGVEILSLEMQNYWRAGHFETVAIDIESAVLIVQPHGRWRLEVGRSDE